MQMTKIPPPIRPTNGKLPVAPKPPLPLRCWRVQKKPFNAVLEEMRPYLIEDRGTVATREMMVLLFFWSRKYNVVDHERDTLSDNVWLWRVGWLTWRVSRAKGACSRWLRWGWRELRSVKIVSSWRLLRGLRLQRRLQLPAWGCSGPSNSFEQLKWCCLLFHCYYKSR